MRTRTTLVGIIAIAAATLTACSSSSGDNGATGATSTPASATKPSPSQSVDCSDPNLPQAEWVKHCDKTASSLHLQFGQTYTWPDGVKVSVVSAKVFTAYDKSIGEKATPGSTDYQVMIKVTNGSQQPLDLSDLSIITEGATNGGQASITSWNNAAPGLEGRVAPGITVTKGDPETLETKFGRKIVVTVQRASGGAVQDFPEFTGTITG